MEEAIREEEEMEGVVLTSSPNKKKRDSVGGRKSGGRKSLQLVEDEVKEGQSGDEDEDPLTMLPASPRKPQGPTQPPSPVKGGPSASSTRSNATMSSTRPKSPVASTASSSATASASSRPTRIARSTMGNAATNSAVMDPSIAMARSRGAKNLNTVFESVEGGNGPKGAPGSTSTRSRYPLRNVSGRTTPNSTSVSSAVPSMSGPIAPNSPSKLPTRIPAKRGVPNSPVVNQSPAPVNMTRGGFDPAAAGKKEESSTNKGFTSLANGLAKLGGSKGGRNVRRRRSSMGSQDFVQAG